VTASGRADATLLRVRRYRMMGLPRCPYVSTYVSTLAGTKAWPGCRWPACARYLSRSCRGAAASCLRGGNVGSAARMNYGDIQQGETMRRGKGHLNVSTCPLTANCGNTNGSVTGLRSRIPAHAGGDTAESHLPMVVPTRAAGTLKDQ
jgi:hypothetical protein